jgi:hypothetical protein
MDLPGHTQSALGSPYALAQDRGEAAPLALQRLHANLAAVIGAGPLGW